MDTAVPPEVVDERTETYCREGVAALDWWYGYPSIQQALDHAEPGGEVLVCPGHWEGTVYITKSLTLRGIVNASATVIDGGGVGRAVVLADSGLDVTIARLTLTGGLADDGGGLYSRGSSRLHLWHVSLTDNIAEAGGGLYALGGEVILEDVTFARNVAEPSKTTVE